MSDFTGDEINTVLKTVKTICPGDDARSGDVQLSILAMALCIAAHDCEVSRENFLAHVEEHFDRAGQCVLIPLPPHNRRTDHG